MVSGDEVTTGWACYFLTDSVSMYVYLKRFFDAASLFATRRTAPNSTRYDVFQGKYTQDIRPFL
jgi:hypothetical protein